MSKNSKRDVDFWRVRALHTRTHTRTCVRGCEHDLGDSLSYGTRRRGHHVNSRCVIKCLGRKSNYVREKKERYR